MAELTPEQKRQARMDELKAEREKKMAADVAARAATNPKFNPAVRPEAPQNNPGYVQYYSWIGGATSGEWRLYQTPEGSAMADSALARSTGGITQAKGASAVGANVLSNNQSGFTPTGVKVEKTGTTDVYKGTGTTGDPLTFNGSPYTGTRNGVRYVNGVVQTDNTGNQFGKTSGSGTASDPLIVNGTAFSGVLGGVNYTNGVAQNQGTGNTGDDAETKQRRSAQQEFLAALNELGLGDLYDTINTMITEDKTVAAIKLELPKTKAYQQRFPGMQALRDAGRAISEATYISNERGYLQTLRAYGLDEAVLGSRAELGKYIANEVSPREFEERVNIAATRVKENPDVMQAFKTYYPEADQGGVIAYLLNPKAGMDIIRKQIKTSEIGAAATKAGFDTQKLVTAEYAGTLIGAVGETGYAQIANEFQRARLLANTQRRLAQIEGQQYTDLEAIGAVVGDDVTKALASERRAARETARFGGGAGLSGGSLRSTTNIQRILTLTDQPRGAYKSGSNSQCSFPELHCGLRIQLTKKGDRQMATNYEYDDEDDDTTTDVVSQLRKVNRALEKRAKELEQELSGLRTQTRQRTVKDVLQAKGLNPKIAAFIPQDIDSSEEAITNWVNEYGDVFGVQAPTEEKPVKTNSEVAAQARINNLVATGTAPDVDEDAFAKIAGAKTREDLDALLGLN